MVLFSFVLICLNSQFTVVWVSFGRDRNNTCCHLPSYLLRNLLLTETKTRQDKFGFQRPLILSSFA